MRQGPVSRPSAFATASPSHAATYGQGFAFAQAVDEDQRTSAA